MMMFCSSSLMLIIFDGEGEVVSIINENNEMRISVARENDAADLFQIVTLLLFPIAAEVAARAPQQWQTGATSCAAVCKRL